LKALEVLERIREGNFKLNPYAQTYIKALPDAEREYGEEGVKAQINYIFCNIRAKKGLQQQIKKELLKYANS